MTTKAKLRAFLEWARSNNPDFELKCADCGFDTNAGGEYYMVHDQIWHQACAAKPVPTDQAILCIGCLERRIGRTLTKCDFSDVPLNDYEVAGDHWSETLRDRLGVVS